MDGGGFERCAGRVLVESVGKAAEVRGRGWPRHTRPLLQLASCGTKPVMERSAASFMGRPLTRMRPRWRPLAPAVPRSTLSSVVLPAPEGPITADTRLCSNLPVTPDRMVRPSCRSSPSPSNPSVRRGRTAVKARKACLRWAGGGEEREADGGQHEGGDEKSPPRPHAIRRQYLCPSMPSLTVSCPGRRRPAEGAARAAAAPAPPAAPPGGGGPARGRHGAPRRPATWRPWRSTG